jgi:MoxR-like ATPase
MKPKRVKEFIVRAIEKPNEVPPIHLWGPPGVGKSMIVDETTREKQVGFVDMRLAQRDPTDLRGIPAVIDGKSRWLSPPELPTEHFCLECRTVLQSVLTEGKKELCPICKGDKLTDKGILFLDELTSCPPLTQASAYQLTLDRRISEYILPDGWYVMAAGNRIEDRAVVYRMSTALANRFTHIDFEPNLEDWTEWALLHDINPNIIGFLQWKPNLLFSFNPESNEKAFPTPRSWEFASKISAVSTKGMLHELLDGTIGKGASAEYIAFLKIQESIPDIEPILAGKSNYVPAKMDMKYALVSALASRAKKQQFENLLKYSKHLPVEYSVLLAMMMVAKDETAVAGCPSWEDWAKEHKDVLVRKG